MGGGLGGVGQEYGGRIGRVLIYTFKRGWCASQGELLKPVQAKVTGGNGEKTGKKKKQVEENAQLLKNYVEKQFENA